MINTSLYHQEHIIYEHNVKSIPDPVQRSLAEPMPRWTWKLCRGGLSGAILWQGIDPMGHIRVALKCWPAEMTPQRLGQIHKWMQQAHHLPFVPRIHTWLHGGTVWIHDGRCWDLIRWQPGRPRDKPTLKEVELACQAVGQLHTAWPVQRYGPCPAVQSRLHWLNRWLSAPRVSDGLLRRYSPWESILRDAERILREHAEAVLERLVYWIGLEGSLQVCVRDLRAEHVLFTDTEGTLTVSGIVDFGAAQVDHPIVDLARLLGDYAASAPAQFDEFFAAGVQAYETTGRYLGQWRDCVPLLSQAGALAAVIRWMDRLECDTAIPASPEVAFQRIHELLRPWL
ncbi:MAG: hypothetical protein KatS3mg107_0693 [Gemmataceae bacterium]|nr:MAG: hypothetical protein KatS3mg107_0693 [Gemmataceae bacterium]